MLRRRRRGSGAHRYAVANDRQSRDCSRHDNSKAQSWRAWRSVCSGMPVIRRQSDGPHTLRGYTMDRQAHDKFGRNLMEIRRRFAPSSSPGRLHGPAGPGARTGVGPA